MVKEINSGHRPKVNRILKEEWNCPPSVSKGKLYDTTKLPGFIFLQNKTIEGVITYNIEIRNAKS